jgi:hypothetical protein
MIGAVVIVLGILRERGNMSTADKIIKIKELLDSGALTQEQYNLLKREVMTEVASKTQVIDTPSDTENTAQVLSVEAIPVISDSTGTSKPVDPSVNYRYKVGGIGVDPIDIVVVVVGVVVVVVMGALIFILVPFMTIGLQN